MDYTLDSLELVKSALKAKNQNKKIYSEAVILSGDQLNDLKQTEDRYYFGYFTSGIGTKTKLAYLGHIFIELDDESQMISVFTDAEFVDLTDVAMPNPVGMFTGFIIQLQY